MYFSIWEKGNTMCACAAAMLQHVVQSRSRGRATRVASKGIWPKCSNRPVLKHGPRSLTCVRVFEWKTQMRNESDGWCGRSSGRCANTCGSNASLKKWQAESTCDFIVSRRVGAYMLGPERWWTMLEQGEARGNSGGSPKRYWRANRSPDLSIGAKD